MQKVKMNAEVDRALNDYSREYAPRRALKRRLDAWKPRPASKGSTAVRPFKGRHPRWQMQHAYRLVRAAKPLSSLDDLRKRALRGTLSLQNDVYEWRLRDASAERNAHLPVHEAVHRVGSHWVLVQKGHLRAMYRKAGRTDAARAAETLEDGTAYWVDRHVAKN